MRASYGELLVVLRLPQATAELLEPEDPRLRGPQHEDGVELGEVEALVEDVDRTDDLKVAVRQLLLIAADQEQAVIRPRAVHHHHQQHVRVGSDSQITFAQSGHDPARDQIGRRYRRQDEIGTPYCLTVDFDSLKDNSVTIRDRDSTKQTRVKINEVKSKLEKPLT